jgi:hypothetical protein
MGRLRIILVCIPGTRILLVNWLVRVWVRFLAQVISLRVRIRLYARIVLYMRGRRSLGFIASGMEAMVMPEG